MQVASAVATTVHEQMDSELFASLVATCLDGLEAWLPEATIGQSQENNNQVSTVSGSG